jgi:antitoxin (DNA-binding transcriptional repressor) of toxin-antitoxin stability system
MAHTIIHISEAEAENDFGSVLARVREAAEVVIDSKAGGRPVAVVRPPDAPPGRLLSESIALAKARRDDRKITGSRSRIRCGR